MCSTIFLIAMSLPFLLSFSALAEGTANSLIHFFIRPPPGPLGSYGEGNGSIRGETARPAPQAATLELLWRPMASRRAQALVSTGRGPSARRHRGSCRRARATIGP